VDDKYIGVTPLTAKLRKGHRRIIISKPGYHSVEGAINGISGEIIDNAYILKEIAPPVPSLKKLSSKQPAKSKNTHSIEKDAAKNLLSVAQKNKISRKWSEAAQNYQDLINRYPNSSEANTARISLGKLLHKKLGNSRMALRQFDIYLSKGGPLSQEAMYGKALVLKDMGKNDEEKKTLQKFINLYPSAIAAPAAQKRLKELK
jgi:TolA-binding protein